MLIISLFVHIQHCIKRYQSRKVLARLSLNELSDVGITPESRQEEVAQATIYGFSQDLVSQVKKQG